MGAASSSFPGVTPVPGGEIACVVTGAFKSAREFRIIVILRRVSVAIKPILAQRRSRPFVDGRNRPDVSETHADNVLISRTVKDLVAASGTGFEDFGAHVVKRIDQRSRLFEWLSLLSLFAALPRKMQPRWIAFRIGRPRHSSRGVPLGRVPDRPNLKVRPLPAQPAPAAEDRFLSLSNPSLR
jgi:hypothetical protein